MNVLLAVLLAAVAAPAWACDELRDLRRETTVQLFATMSDEGADPLERILAFEDLRCSSLGAVRDRAYRVAAATNEPTLRSEALWYALSSKTLISIDLLNEGELGKAEVEYLARTPTLDFPVHSVDEAARCISLWDTGGGCFPGRQLAVSGREVDLVYEMTAGTFRFSTEDTAYGTVTVRDGGANLTLPAAIRLF
jgi:hypothetical protein